MPESSILCYGRELFDVDMFCGMYFDIIAYPRAVWPTNRNYIDLPWNKNLYLGCCLRLSSYATNECGHKCHYCPISFMSPFLSHEKELGSQFDESRGSLVLEELSRNSYRYNVSVGLDGGNEQWNTATQYFFHFKIEYLEQTVQSISWAEPFQMKNSIWYLNVETENLNSENIRLATRWFYDTKRYLGLMTTNWQAQSTSS